MKADRLKAVRDGVHQAVQNHPQKAFRAGDHRIAARLFHPGRLQAHQEAAPHQAGHHQHRQGAHPAFPGGLQVQEEARRQDLPAVEKHAAAEQAESKIKLSIFESFFYFRISGNKKKY